MKPGPGKTLVDLATFKRDMKALGYKVAIRTWSEWKNATVSKDGTVINAGNVFERTFLDAHSAFFEYQCKTSVADGEWRVIF